MTTLHKLHLLEFSHSSRDTVLTDGHYKPRNADYATYQPFDRLTCHRGARCPSRSPHQSARQRRQGWGEGTRVYSARPGTRLWRSADRHQLSGSYGTLDTHSTCAQNGKNVSLSKFQGFLGKSVGRSKVAVEHGRPATRARLIHTSLPLLQRLLHSPVLLPQGWNARLHPRGTGLQGRLWRVQEARRRGCVPVCGVVSQCSEVSHTKQSLA